MDNRYLFFIQVFLILLLFYFGDFNSIFTNGLLTIPFIFGLVLALWSYYNMGSKNFSPFPEPRKGSKIVEGGSYRYIRHPMYTGVLLIAVVLFISKASFLSFLVLALLVYVIDEKAKLEEDLLAKLHKEYLEYQQKTKKFIPKLY